MKQSFLIIAALVALALPGVASAQSRNKPDIPASERPPAGMCRIWLDNVPAAQQPAPTDCATAVRNRPENGRVIFGDDYVQQKRQDSGRVGKPGINGFAPPADKKKNKRSPLIRLP